jgi:hypothetical protein
MIKFVADTNTDEGMAAEELRRLMSTAWPWLAESNDDHATIVARARCYGERRQDLDLVVLLDLTSDRAVFRPTTALKDTAGNPFDANEVMIKTLALVIEVKGHTPENVRFEGPKVFVKYVRGGHAEWHDATQQSDEQVHSLRGYIERNLGHNAVPWVDNLVWLRSVVAKSLPSGLHRIVPQKMSWSGILGIAAANRQVVRMGNKGLVSCFKRDTPSSLPDVQELLSKSLRPTELDRVRMDRIARASVDSEWTDAVGQRQILLQGLGGTGKTVRMIALAWKLRENGQRVVMLTYNVALVADLRRLLTLMGMTDGIGEPCIRVQTVHSFLGSWLSRTGGLPAGGDLLRDYEPAKQQLLAELVGGAMTIDDIEAYKAKDADTLSWDCVMIDEGQDWPTNERDLLHSLYSHRRIVVADGCDQLVRRTQSCDWTANGKLGTKEVLRVKLRRGLRMKPNLSTFANSLAASLGLANWEIEANPDTAGGRVMVIEGEYADARKCHETLICAARVAQNQPVDLLSLVPPQLVGTSNDRRSSPVLTLFESWGHHCWNGLEREDRASYPTDPEQLRVLQYDSCRGLEGWTVLAIRADLFFEYKLAEWKSLPVTGADDAQAARRSAARWMMIPCTRAIDTLVINVGREPSSLKTVLAKVRDQHPDIIEWEEC